MINQLLNMGTSIFLKRISLFVVAVVCIAFSLMSLWETQSISLSTSNNVTTIDADSSSSWFAKGPSPSSTPTPSGTPTSSATPSSSVSPSRSPPPPSRSPSKTPSTSPTPYAIFIPTTIRGNRTGKIFPKYTVDTTINTPVEIHLDQLFGDWFLSEVSFSTEQPSYGQLISPNNNNYTGITSVIYMPKDWYTGYDKFSCTGKDLVTGEERQETVQIRIRIGVVINRPVLVTPAGYNFSEVNSGGTIELKNVLKSLVNNSVIHEQDTWLDRRYKTCAVVGNGGSLRGRKRGSEIDSHDVVVRINLSPFLNHTEDVGSKLTIAVNNGPTAKDCWKRHSSLLPVDFQYEILAQATFKMHWLKFENCQTQNPNIHYMPMSYLFVDLVDSILNEYHRVMFNGTTKKYRSTGMLAVTAMAMICDHVSVYGFERGPNMENNYYESSYDREWSGHSFTAEKAYFKDLAMGTGLFEPFLELYDLYTSFSYIMD